MLDLLNTAVFDVISHSTTDNISIGLICNVTWTVAIKNRLRREKSIVVGDKKRSRWMVKISDIKQRIGR